jgi:hypothetical protein
MTRWIAVMFLGLASVAFLAGCEWESSGSDSSWDDSMSWANFSGTYRDADGGALATTFGTSAGSSTQIVSVTGEILATADFSSSAYNGTLDNTPIVAGSVVINGGSLTWTDNGDGTLSGTAGVDGTVSYAGGTWTVDLKSNRIADGELISAAYRYTSGGSSGQVDQGNTGDPIYILTVTQTGNNLVMTDNNGAKYSGSIHSLSAPNGDATGGSSGAVQGNFEVSGNSASGARVTITGSLSGTYTAAVTATGSSGASASRAANMTALKMEGTWVEDGGTSGDIRAVVQ